MTPSGPPGLAERILRVLLPGDYSEEILHGLARDFGRRVAGAWSRGGVRAWCWGQLLAPDTWRLVILLRARRRNPGRSGNRARDRGVLRGSGLDFPEYPVSTKGIIPAK